MAPLRRRRSQPPLESLEEQLDREGASDLLDVPAAVVCARCGDAECAGCENAASRSGIVAVIAWERPAVPVLVRLWVTARSATANADTFFEGLPDGPLLPAFRFAAICEVLATTAMLLVLLPIAGLVAPGWLSHVALDPSARSLALRLLVLGIPAFAALLVTAHVAHGLSIDLGARRQGARPSRARALRFGLYACGWDLVIGPLGAIVLSLEAGVASALALTSHGAGLPTRATKAFLRGCYRLDGARARAALGTSYVGAAVATALGALAILASIVAVVLL